MWVTQTSWSPSVNTTFAGPCQLPGRCPFRHAKTWPTDFFRMDLGWVGHGVVMPDGVEIRVSIMKAFWADALLARFCWNTPVFSWNGGPVPTIHSLWLLLPASHRDLPKTRISGEYPLWREMLFFAEVQWDRASLNSSWVEMVWSIWYLFNMCWRIDPWRSHLPICQWASAGMTTHRISNCWSCWLNSSLQNSPALSHTNWTGDPAQRIQLSRIPFQTLWDVRLSVGNATWKLVAESNMW